MRLHTHKHSPEFLSSAAFLAWRVRSSAHDHNTKGTCTQAIRTIIINRKNVCQFNHQFSLFAFAFRIFTHLLRLLPKLSVSWIRVFVEIKIKIMNHSLWDFSSRNTSANRQCVFMFLSLFTHIKSVQRACSMQDDVKWTTHTQRKHTLFACIA